MVRLYFDGACEPYNPGGHGAWGVWIEGLRDDPCGFCGYIGKGPGVTNNVAEYTGLIRGLEYLVNQGVRNCEVRGDSQLAIYQMVGRYRVKSPIIRPLWERARAAADRIGNVKFKWVRREKNSKADLQSRYGFYLSVAPRAALVLDTYKVEEKGEELLFLKPGAESPWTVRRSKNGLYVCDCPAYSRSRIGVCKHAAAAWMRAYRNH